MKLVGNTITIATLAAFSAVSLPVSAFYSPCTPNNSARSTSQLEAEAQTRGDFLSTVAAVTSTLIINPIRPAYARGRASLEQSYERYTSRIIEGGAFYKSQLYGAVSKGDWEGLVTATAEPPKKTKADRALEDGGAAKRAAQAGGFSDARVLTAMDLFASTFSEASISPKTKAMKEEVETLREVVEGMNKAARIAKGEEKGGGGLFGIGGKAPSRGELSKEVKDLYMKGGTAYNQYIFLANEGLPIQLAKLPFL